jgi:8-oxo-dGTP diphosphatase
VEDLLMQMMQKVVRVACAVIEDGGTVLAAQRNETMHMPLKWEFPGGKLHAGESAEACLARELMEELGVHIRILRPLPPVFHCYEDFTIELIPFVCAIAGGNLQLHEHRAIAWLKPQLLSGLDWPAADIPVIASYLASLQSSAPVSAD